LVKNLIVAANQRGTVHFEYALREGQRVKVAAGPLADLVGRLERLDEKGRVSVLLELMGSLVRVALLQRLLAPNDDAAA
jgi:transcription antitermination factor NusG